MRRVCTKVRTNGSQFPHEDTCNEVRILMPPYGHDER